MGNGWQRGRNKNAAWRIFLLTGVSEKRIKAVLTAIKPKQNGDKKMSMQSRMDARRIQMMRELQSDLADLVESGDITPAQANEWANDKAEQWAREF